MSVIWGLWGRHIIIIIIVITVVDRLVLSVDLGHRPHPRQVYRQTHEDKKNVQLIFKFGFPGTRC